MVDGNEREKIVQELEQNGMRLIEFGVVQPMAGDNILKFSVEAPLLGYYPGLPAFISVNVPVALVGDGDWLYNAGNQALRKWLDKRQRDDKRQRNSAAVDTKELDIKELCARFVALGCDIHDYGEETVDDGAGIRRRALRFRVTRPDKLEEWIEVDVATAQRCPSGSTAYMLHKLESWLELYEQERANANAVQAFRERACMVHEWARRRDGIVCVHCGKVGKGKVLGGRVVSVEPADATSESFTGEAPKMGGRGRILINGVECFERREIHRRFAGYSPARGLLNRRQRTVDRRAPGGVGALSQAEMTRLQGELTTAGAGPGEVTYTPEPSNAAGGGHITSPGYSGKDRRTRLERRKREDWLVAEQFGYTRRGERRSRPVTAADVVAQRRESAKRAELEAKKLDGAVPATVGDVAAFCQAVLDARWVQRAAVDRRQKQDIRKAWKAFRRRSSGRRRDDRSSGSMRPLETLGRDQGWHSLHQASNELRLLLDESYGPVGKEILLTAEEKQWRKVDRDRSHIHWREDRHAQSFGDVIGPILMWLFVGAVFGCMGVGFVTIMFTSWKIIAGWF